MKNSKSSYLYKNLIVLFLILSSVSIDAQVQLKTGTIAPKIIASDSNDNNINLDNLTANGPVVLIFYRGEWCKYCNLYMRDLSDSLSMITDKGATVLAVTPESVFFINETVSKTNASFSIVFDVGHKIMDEYKVTWYVGKFAHFFYRLSGRNLKKAHNSNERALPVPATYIIGTDGIIKGGYFNKDYTKRMPIKAIVNVLNTL